ncbi:MAG: GDYXXLXY domain-containing protein [Desulfovibrionaceae bacterium]|nr:GDYXXLXY domain-containing protein [Desulfovibrionaceae bacterium]
MSDPRRVRIFIALVLLIFLAAYNYLILGQEKLLADGRRVILRLVPLDPRSLMQGDYMILAFAVERDILKAMREQDKKEGEEEESSRKRRGLAVLRLEGDLGCFVRLHAGEKPAPDEILLEYKMTGRDIKVSGGAFFFEEGLAGLYSQARYAELRVAPGGWSLIKNLLDQDMRILRKEEGVLENR